jgi:diguanylate cyclase (GGDEF)-like protein
VIDAKEQAQRDIERVLGELRTHIRRAVRAEQLHDPLTGLPNDAALSEWIQTRIDEGAAFWLAFIEVDRFKNVNDVFGYEAADDLLRRISGQLKTAAQDFFGETCIPFRAHGDEFYLAGAGPTGDLHDSLDRLRSAIGGIRVTFPDKPAPMRCTVSIGWATSTEAQSEPSGLTLRGLRGLVEIGVQQAKRDRDTVVRFAPELRGFVGREGRADCGRCRAKFSMHVPASDPHGEQLFCPNCGERLARPPSLQL